MRVFLPACLDCAIMHARLASFGVGFWVFTNECGRSVIAEDLGLLAPCDTEARTWVQPGSFGSAQFEVQGSIAGCVAATWMCLVSYLVVSKFLCQWGIDRERKRVGVLWSVQRMIFKTM